MRDYLDLLAYVHDKGRPKDDRTGTGTYQVFGAQLRHDLSKGFPLLTTKKLHWHSIRTELLWMLRGDTNVSYLRTHGVTIWDEWAGPLGNLGPVYGRQWRSWGCGRDQLLQLISDLRSNPSGRRHIISAWNPDQVHHMALPPCHAFMQFDVTDGRLSCHMYQRSADIFLGVPFNIASYALLTTLIAMEVHLEPGELVISYGDLHLYKNHVAQAEEQLRRKPRPLPQLGVHFKQGAMLYRKDDDEGPFYEPSDLLIANYDPHPGIKAEVAV